MAVCWNCATEQAGGTCTVCGVALVPDPTPWTPDWAAGDQVGGDWQSPDVTAQAGAPGWPGQTPPPLAPPYQAAAPSYVAAVPSAAPTRTRSSAPVIAGVVGGAVLVAGVAAWLGGAFNGVTGRAQPAPTNTVTVVVTEPVASTTSPTASAPVPVTVLTSAVPAAPASTSRPAQTQSSAPAPAPITVTVPAPAPVTSSGPWVPAVGTYSGPGIQSDSPDYWTVAIRFTGTTGSVAYSPPGKAVKCAGTLAQLGNGTWRESITTGTCDDLGTWTFTPIGGGGVHGYYEPPTGRTYTLKVDLKRTG